MPLNYYIFVVYYSVNYKQLENNFFSSYLLKVTIKGTQNLRPLTGPVK